MCTSVGHALGGLTAVWASEAAAGQSLAPGLEGSQKPRPAEPRAWWPLLCAALGALPDADLLFHTHRTASHSVTAVLLISIVAMGVTGKVTRRTSVVAGVVCGAAYGSHLLLDWLAMDRYWPFGIQALWPFSDAWFISSWDVFPQVKRQAFLDAATIRFNLGTIAFELSRLVPVAGACWLVRRWRLVRSPDRTSAGERAGR